MPISPETLHNLNITELQLTEALIKDVQDVFSTMLGVDDITPIPVQTELPHPGCDCLTAMVGLVGRYNGLVCIKLPLPLALAFTSLMLDMEVTEINDDVHDAMGEIANMIGGSFKQHLSRAGDDVKLSTPSVVCGSDYTVSAGSKMDDFTLYLKAGQEMFAISVTIEN
ncbi:MAG TPA: chemotaxis protein CheX [Desulfuromonadales bacterium]|nr:chemotaxis protein CheX [Desulfuromonadales bacterium]